MYAKLLKWGNKNTVTQGDEKKSTKFEGNANTSFMQNNRKRLLLACHLLEITGINYFFRK